MILFLLALLLMPSLAHAAYQNPTVISNERQPSGSTKLIFRFAGNAGEPVVTREYMVGPATTATILRNWVDATLNELDLTHTAATIPSLQAGQTVPRLAPVPPATSAKDVWQQKVSMYKQACTNGFIGSVATACTALKSDIETTYQAGFLDAN